MKYRHINKPAEISSPGTLMRRMLTAWTGSNDIICCATPRLYSFLNIVDCVLAKIEATKFQKVRPYKKFISNDTH